MDIFFAVTGNVGTLWNVLTNDFVSILHEALLPRRMFVAEVYFDMKFFLQTFVVYEKQIVVESHRFEFRKALPDSFNRIFHTLDRDRKYFLQERISGLPISADKKVSFTLMARDNEVSFGVADSLSVLDIPWSFVDHAFVLYFEFNFPFAPSSVVNLGSVSLNFAAIWAFEIFSYGDSGNIRQIFVVSLNPL